MNFLGREIDESTINRIKSFMNTPEGKKLKEKISTMNKTDIENIMKNAKENKDINEIKNLVNLSDEEIENIINKTK